MTQHVHLLSLKHRLNICYEASIKSTETPKVNTRRKLRRLQLHQNKLDKAEINKHARSSSEMFWWKGLETRGFFMFMSVLCEV